MFKSPLEVDHLYFQHWYIIRYQIYSHTVKLRLRHFNRSPLVKSYLMNKKNFLLTLTLCHHPRVPIMVSSLILVYPLRHTFHSDSTLHAVLGD